MNKFSLVLSLFLLVSINFVIAAENSNVKNLIDLKDGLNKIEQKCTVIGMLVSGDNIFSDTYATFLTNKLFDLWVADYLELNFYNEDIVSKMKSDKESISKGDDLCFYITIRLDQKDQIIDKIKSKIKAHLVNDEGKIVELNNFFIRNISKDKPEYRKIMVVFPRRIPTGFRSEQAKYIQNKDTKILKMFLEIDDSIYMYKFDMTKVN